MGNRNAQDIANAAQDGLVSLDAALHYHLTANHYPPIPATCIEAAKEAIAAIEAGEYNKAITLPAGAAYRDSSTAPASAVVEAWHLDAFIDSGE